MQIRPLGNRILVQRLKAEEVSTGGILIPQTAQEKELRGKVIAVGPGRLLESGRRVEPRVRTGDVILFGRYAGTEISRRQAEVGDDLLVISEDDVLGVEEPTQ